KQSSLRRKRLWLQHKRLHPRSMQLRHLLCDQRLCRQQMTGRGAIRQRLACSTRVWYAPSEYALMPCQDRIDA
ncbi:MAG: hypothetical protein ACPIOQ_79805, partial [Promethearchaeia archaeon]